MKKAPVFFSMFLLLFGAAASVWAQTPNTGWYTANPGSARFQISTADELAGLAQLVNSNTDNFFRKTVVLANDISLSGYSSGQGWTPIGNSDLRIFAGVFEGNGKTVSGLFINAPNASSVGLFGGVTDSGKVRNLGVAGADITGGKYVGGIAGTLYGRSMIVNCHFSGAIKGEAEVGGIVGFNFGSVVENCRSAGTVTGDNMVGGIVGHNSVGNVESSSSTGPVSGFLEIGGVVGSVRSGTVKNCYSAGPVSGGNDGRGVGGVAGHSGGAVENCYSIGPVSGGWEVGGVVGAAMRSGSEVINCAALNPNVTGAGTFGIGRVVGSNPPQPMPFVNNAAFSDMAFNGNDGNSDGPYPTSHDGAGISAAQIRADGTIGGRFTVENGWTVENGKLPGLNGKPVDMPLYLLSTYAVGFDLNGGAGLPPAAVIVLRDNAGPLAETQKPSTASYTKAGYVLVDDNWYIRSGSLPNFTYTKFVFGAGGTVVDRDITLYLQWRVDPEWYDPAITGAGTSASPYIINNAKQLAYIALMVNGGNVAYGSAHYRMDSDIDLSGYGAGSKFNGGRGWIPIGGMYPNSFGGAFDGNARRITGLYINDPNRDYAGLFGYITGVVSRVGLEGVNIIGRHNTGGIAGIVNGFFSGSVSGVVNAYVTGAVSGGSWVGGVVGSVGKNGVVGESYSAAAVSGAHSVGGIAGTVLMGSKAYDNAALNPSVIVTGSGNAGRVVGALGADGVGGSIAIGPDGSIIENIDVWETPDNLAKTFARNLAFAGMLNRAWNTGWARKGAGDLDGEDLPLEDILASPELNGKFTPALGYSVEPGFLPGYGAPVPLPFHLGGELVPVADITGVPAAAPASFALTGAVYPADASNRLIVWSVVDAGATGAAITTGGVLSAASYGEITIRATIADGMDVGADYTQDFTITISPLIGVLSNDRVVRPTEPSAEAAVVAPVANRQTGEFTAGPNPAAKSAGAINFYYSTSNASAGTSVLAVNGALTIYDASGNAVNKININAKSFKNSVNPAHRQIGSWNLIDKRRRPVADGTYLVKGAVTVNGKRERVSLVVNVR